MSASGTRYFALVSPLVAAPLLLSPCEKGSSWALSGKKRDKPPRIATSITWREQVWPACSLTCAISNRTDQEQAHPAQRSQMLQRVHPSPPKLTGLLAPACYAPLARPMITQFQ